MRFDDVFGTGCVFIVLIVAVIVALSSLVEVAR